MAGPPEQSSTPSPNPAPTVSTARRTSLIATSSSTRATSSSPLAPPSVASSSEGQQELRSSRTRPLSSSTTRAFAKASPSQPRSRSPTRVLVQRQCQLLSPISHYGQRLRPVLPTPTPEESESNRSIPLSLPARA